MITGIGIDVLSTTRIKPSCHLANKILSQAELKFYHQFSSYKRQQEFLAGRWALKEAILKAYHVKTSMKALNIKLTNQKLILENSQSFLPKAYRIFLSLSHDVDVSVGLAVIEKLNS